MQTTEPVRKAVQSMDEIGEPSAKQVAAIMPEKSEAEALASWFESSCQRESQRNNLIQDLLRQMVQVHKTTTFVCLWD